MDRRKTEKSNKLSHSWCFFFFALCSIRSSSRSRSSFQSAAANRRAKKQKCGTRQHATKKKRTNFSFLFFYLAFDLKVCSWLIHLHPLLLLFLSLFFSHTFFNQIANSGGSHSTMDNVLASHPAAPGSILGPPVPRFINHCLVTGQWHSNKPI